MFSTAGTVSLDAIGTLAQVLPGLLAIGLLVPLLTRMPLQTPERSLFRWQTVYVLLVEAVLLYFLIQGDPAPAALRWIFATAALWSLLGIAIVVLAWSRSTKAERDAERQAYREAKAGRAHQTPADPKGKRERREQKPKRGRRR